MPHKTSFSDKGIRECLYGRRKMTVFEMES
jgi:hypothetical protein